MRLQIAHDYRELKRELGLGRYEGRGWRGFHHHANLSQRDYQAAGFCDRRHKARLQRLADAGRSDWSCACLDGGENGGAESSPNLFSLRFRNKIPDVRLFGLV